MHSQASLQRNKKPRTPCALEFRNSSSLDSTGSLRLESPVCCAREQLSAYLSLYSGQGDSHLHYSLHVKDFISWEIQMDLSWRFRNNEIILYQILYNFQNVSPKRLFFFYFCNCKNNSLFLTRSMILHNVTQAFQKLLLNNGATQAALDL